MLQHGIQQMPMRYMYRPVQLPPVVKIGTTKNLKRCTIDALPKKSVKSMVSGISEQRYYLFFPCIFSHLTIIYSHSYRENYIVIFALFPHFSICIFFVEIRIFAPKAAFPLSDEEKYVSGYQMFIIRIKDIHSLRKRFLIKK